MTNLQNWAIRHGVAHDALDELRVVLIGCEADGSGGDFAGGSEAAALARVRLAASREGSRLWRNNVGACTTETGSFIRFGLANETAAVNAQCKSADLIGVKPLRITPSHIGSVVGQFYSREVKKPGWVFSNTPREAAQLRWIEILVGLGADAAFTTGELK